MKKLLYLSICFILLISACLSTESTTKKTENREVTITENDYPPFFDYLASKGGRYDSTNFERDVMYFHRNQLQQIPAEDLNKVYWENYEFFINKVLEVPGYISVEEYKERKDRIKSIEKFYLYRPYNLNHLAHDYIEKTRFENTSMVSYIMPYTYTNPSSSYFSLSMLLYIDDKVIRLNEDRPIIGEKGWLTAYFGIGKYAKEIISCTVFGYNLRNKKMMIDDKTLKKLKIFLSD